MSNASLQRTYDVMKKIEFLVVCDYVMTPTAQTLGDLFLPVAMFCEKENMRSNYINLGAMKIVDGIDRGDVLSDAEISFEMGRRFNKEMYPWDDARGLVDAILEPSGFTYQDLYEMNFWYPDFEYRRYETGKLRGDGKPGFPTPTGRIELYSNMADSIGCHPLPYYAEPYEGPISTPEIYEEYPCIVISGTRFINYFHSEHRQVPKLLEITPDPIFEINDEYAKELGIRDGDWCWIENSRGRIRQRAKVTPIIAYRIANVCSGWWFPETDPHDDPMYGCWDVNPNLLCEPGYQGETGFGADVKSLLCKIYKV
jgi:anaerobic selenocysteine-containing dehydrogenase